MSVAAAPNSMIAHARKITRAYDRFEKPTMKHRRIGVKQRIIPGISTSMKTGRLA